MSTAIGHRRYLTNFEPHRLPHLFTDVLIVGSGAAGLAAALRAADDSDVLVVTKDRIDHSATSWAQGGIAAATVVGDSPAQHAADTLDVAYGLAHASVVRSIVAQGPAMVELLRAYGAQFDQTGDSLAVGREAAHSQPRIIHAHDTTGREIQRVLVEQVRQRPRIRVFEDCFTIDVLTDNGQAVGVVTYHPKYGHQMFWATTVILATGGCGRVFRETSNPPVASGDGLAIALRAGALLRDVEMIQFHPTTLYVAGAARELISEAVRGDGAYLAGRDGQRFMHRYDERGELAPRDVVSRAITSEMRQQHAPCMYLDVRHFGAGRFAERFPHLDQLCRSFDIDPQRDLIPVRPSAHYSVGGVIADVHGVTNITGLLACGELASTGLHGANRLASNSLLESLVCGINAGALAARRAHEHGRRDRPLPISHLLPRSSRTELDLDDVRNSLRSVMSRNVGVERTSDRLRETIEIIGFWSRYVMDKVFDGVPAWETQNLLTVALLIATGAATRCESRGVHFRSDFPETDPQWACHIDQRRSEEGTQVATSRVTD